MSGAVVRWSLKSLAIVLALAPTAHAQQRTNVAGAMGPQVSPGVGINPFANPYTNPYANPFINPYMTQFNTSPQNAALYFFAAQQATGGIGSGRLSGVRLGPAATTRGKEPAAPAQAERPPGVPSSVARYFQRGPHPTGTGSYYNRQGRYYSQDRR